MRFFFFASLLFAHRLPDGVVSAVSGISIKSEESCKHSFWLYAAISCRWRDIEESRSCLYTPSYRNVCYILCRCAEWFSASWSWSRSQEKLSIRIMWSFFDHLNNNLLLTPSSRQRTWTFFSCRLCMQRILLRLLQDRSSYSQLLAMRLVISFWCLLLTHRNYSYVLSRGVKWGLLGSKVRLRIKIWDKEKITSSQKRVRSTCWCYSRRTFC